MTYLPISLDEMRGALQDVHSIVPKYGLTPESLPRIVQLYREALLPYDAEAVRGGSKLLMKTAEKFPTPSKWLEAIHEWAKRNRVRIEYKGEQDAQQRDIVCRVCKSVGKLAWLTRADGEEVERRVAFCDPDLHNVGDLYTPQPENFIEWSANQ